MARSTIYKVLGFTNPKFTNSRESTACYVTVTNTAQIQMVFGALVLSTYCRWWACDYAPSLFTLSRCSSPSLPFVHLAHSSLHSCKLPLASSSLDVKTYCGINFYNLASREMLWYLSWDGGTQDGVVVRAGFGVL